MKLSQKCKAMHIGIILALVLLLSNQSLACFLPSPVEMGEDGAMACCAEHCRFETSDQAAQKACEQSRQAPRQHEVLSGLSAAPVLEMVKLLPYPGSVLPIDFAFHDPIHSHSPQHVNELGFSKRFLSVEIYTLIHSLLI